MSTSKNNKESKFSSNFYLIMAAVCLALGFLYMFMVTFLPIEKDNIRFADSVLGFMMGTVVSTIIYFFFGSSKGSSDKSKIIEKIK